MRNNNNYFVESLFFTPLYTTVLEGSDIELVQNEISNKIDNLQFDKKKEWGDTHALSSVDFKKCVITELALIEFRKVLHKNLKNYCDALNFVPRNYLSESWFTLFKKNDYGHSHIHGSADISGVYYYKTNEKDGDIVFDNPSPQAEMSKCFNNNSSWKHSPKTGKLLLFPSYLRHGVQRNTTEEDRISLSFNITFFSDNYDSSFTR
tara:strand:- start:1730 stop:2347 length:618 start_codon:yes stop_codon:yes gene_type:complete